VSTDGPSDRPDEEPDRPPEDRPARESADSQVPEPAKAETRSRQEYFEAINAAGSQEVISFGAMMATRPATERVEWEAPLCRVDLPTVGTDSHWPHSDPSALTRAVHRGSGRISLLPGAMRLQESLGTMRLWQPAGKIG
jgi:hypothetical protein